MADKGLEQQVKDVGALLEIKDALFFALLRRHPDIFDDVTLKDEWRPYIDAIKRRILG